MHRIISQHEPLTFNPPPPLRPSVLLLFYPFIQLDFDFQYSERTAKVLRDIALTAIDNDLVTALVAHLAVRGANAGVRVCDLSLLNSDSRVLYFVCLRTSS